MLSLTSWCQGHQSLNLTKTQNLTKIPFRYINGISLGLMRVIFVIMFTSKYYKFSCWNQPPWPRKLDQGHPSSKLTNPLLTYIHGISVGPIWLIFVELSCLHAKLQISMLKSTPMTSQNRSRSSIFALNQDTPEIHPWHKFGRNVTNMCGVIVFTNKNCKFACWNRPPWPQRIGQGHPSSNLTETLLRYIHGISFGPNATNICWVIVFTSKNCEISCLNYPPWPQK